jgi:glycerol-3-phosphate acyltransferase PlsY
MSIVVSARNRQWNGRRIVGAAMAGYLLGTFPTADLVARRASRADGRLVDLRSEGSGNPGAANALQVLGARAGATVMVGDVVKGALASVVGGAIAGPVGAHVGGSSAVIGHCVPVWNGGRGGKGVAAGVGQCLATFPAAFPVELAVAGLTLAVPRWKQRTYLASLASSACWVVGAVVWWRRALPNLWGPRPTVALPLAAVVSSAVIVTRFVVARPTPSSVRHEPVTSPVTAI